MVHLPGGGAVAVAPGQALARTENRTVRVSPYWESGAMAPWALKERRVVVRLWRGGARGNALGENHYNWENRRHGVGHSCLPLSRYFGWVFFLSFLPAMLLDFPGCLEGSKTQTYLFPYYT